MAAWVCESMSASSQRASASVQMRLTGGAPTTCQSSSTSWPIRYSVPGGRLNPDAGGQSASSSSRMWCVASAPSSIGFFGVGGVFSPPPPPLPHGQRERVFDHEPGRLHDGRLVEAGGLGAEDEGGHRVPPAGVVLVKRLCLPTARLGGWSSHGVSSTGSGAETASWQRPHADLAGGHADARFSVDHCLAGGGRVKGPCLPCAGAW